MIQSTEIRAQGAERQGPGIMDPGTMDNGQNDLRVDSGSHLMSDRVRELEAENARLKSLVGELLVANQRLRECGAASQ